MENQVLLLQEIKDALWVLIYIVGIIAFFIIVRAFAESYRAIRNEIDNMFYNSVSAIYDNENYDEVITFSLNHIQNKPNEAYAYWFLGKAYFEKKEYEEAKKHFIKAIALNPEWEKEWVKPYLEKIEMEATAKNV